MAKRPQATTRWKAICARTRAAQAQIDAYIKGVRFDGPKLPVIVKGPPRHAVEEPEIDLPIVPRPMTPPVPYAPSEIAQKAARSVPRASRKRGPQRCGDCGELGHNARKHIGEPRCVHDLPWKTCPTCSKLVVRTAATAGASAASATSAP